MKHKFKTIIALCLIILFSFPLFACSISSSGGGSQGGSTSGGGSGGSSGGDDDYDDSGTYIEFEDAMLGIKVASYDANSENSVEKAKTMIENLSKDILARLYSYYGTETDLDFADASGVAQYNSEQFLGKNFGYQPSSNEFLNGFNSNYSPAFQSGNEFEIKLDHVKFWALYDEIEEKIKALPENNGKKIFLAYTSLGGENGYLSWESDLVTATPKQDTFVLTLKSNMFLEVIEAMDVSNPNYDRVYKLQMSPIVDGNSQGLIKADYSTKNAISKNWLTKDSATTVSYYINSNYKQLCLAIVDILAGKTPTNETDYNKINEKIKKISHYGILTEGSNGYYTGEIQKVVDYVLNYIIGTDIVKSDQDKIYKFNNDNNKYEQINSGVSQFLYNTTNRYQNASLEKMNGYTLALNHNNFNKTLNSSTTYSFEQILMKTLLSESKEIKEDMPSFVNSLYNFNKLSNNDPAKPYVSSSVSADYLVESGFMNYINIVEILVSTACNAQVAGASEKVYEAVPFGTFYTYYNSSVVDPGNEPEQEEHVPTYNGMGSGFRHYESLVLYPKEGFNFDYMYMVFESISGIDSGVDAYIRYHKQNEGFINFKNTDNSVTDTYFVSNLTIPKGNYSEGFGLEFEFDMKKILKARTFETPSYFVNPCSDDVLLKLSSELQNGALVEYSGENYTYKVKKFAHSKTGNEIEVLTYDNLAEEYIELIFVYDRVSTMNFGFFLTDMSIPNE